MIYFSGWRLSAQLLLAATFFMSVVVADEVSSLDAQHNGQGFVEAKRLSSIRPKYPYEELVKSNGGMVELVFMVDKNGKIYEPLALRSTRPAFEDSALDSLLKYRYSAAKFDGKPVDSRQTIRISFEIAGATNTVSSEFASYYRASTKEFKKDAPSQKKLIKHIKKLQNSNSLTPYAYTRLNIAKYSYALKFGTVDEQIDAIEQILLFENQVAGTSKFIKDEMLISVRRKLVNLNLQIQQYGAALREYEELKKIDSEAKDDYREMFSKVGKISNSDQTVVVPMRITKRGHYATYLFKSTFTFIDASGVIEAMKLRCDRRYAELKFTPDAEYQVPKSWGKCHLQVIGKPGTEAKLAQY